MMPTRWILSALIVLVAAKGAAQMIPIFDPDDFVDPGQHVGPVFASRLVGGAAHDFIDDYRPLHQNTTFVHMVNSFYWKTFDFHYKHSEVFADRGPQRVTMCGCSPPIYFPTPPTRDATPSAPLPESKETLQFGWYHGVPSGRADPPVV